MASDSDPSTTELLDPRHEDGWEDVESDVEDHAFRSLFEEKWFGDVTEMLKHDKEKHGFNYVKIKRQLRWSNAVQCVRRQQIIDLNLRPRFPGPRSIDQFRPGRSQGGSRPAQGLGHISL